jgi:hypothetical protein
MGARINFIFREQEDKPAVVLYSHWGLDEWQRDLAMALEHSKPRWQDTSYFTRMMISYLIQDEVLGETGFGIFAINDITQDLGDDTVIIDMTNRTIMSNVSVDWDNFVQAYLPSSALSTVGASSAEVGVTSR